MKNVNSLGKIYEKNINVKIRKSMGQYYTPDFVIDYILKKTIMNIDVTENPFVSIIDPSCGVGYFLLSAYDILQTKFTQNIDKLKEIYKGKEYIIEIEGRKKTVTANLYWKEENIHYHILKNCIYGADKDPIAVDLTIKGLREKKPSFYIKDLNILECDSLIYWENLSHKEFKYREKNVNIAKLNKFWSKKYNYVVGNPPYIGHKKLPIEYKKWLLKEYSDVFKDKSDISFCFFKRIHDILSPNGVCGIISSRYFMESPTGINLRRYLVEHINILEIVDFYGSDVFKGIGVATAIYFFKKNNDKEDTDYINIHKLNHNYFKVKDKVDINEMINSNIFQSFKLPSKRLNRDRWMIIPDQYYNIYKKIEKKTNIKLDDISISFQGIITGCDKAFVISKKQMIDNEIEIELIKPWIKNKNIQKYKIKKEDMHLIYSDNIKDIKCYPNSISFMKKYKDRLEKRRECKKGMRRWYNLQWGRKETLFEQNKIVFPYKSKINRFSIDYENLYFSADIYGLVIKDEYKDNISLEYLTGLLNSNVYEFYFKLFAKKMGKGIYDYYPNSIMNLNVISDSIVLPIEKLVTDIIEKKDKIDYIQKQINQIIMDYLELNQDERKIIEKNVL